MTAQRRKKRSKRVLLARIRVTGLQRIDRRTNAAQGLYAWRSELLAALGGESEVSPQKMALIEMATRTRLYIDSLDAYIMSQPAIVLKRKKSVMPVIRERQSLVDSLERLLTRIGLDRVPAKVPSLQEYLESKEREEANAEPKDEPQEAPPDEETNNENLQHP